MTHKRTVLITGVSDYWGQRLAQRLLTEEALQIIGLDIEPPEEELRGLDFVQADIRNPLLAELLRDEQVDTVCHMAFIENVQRSEAIFSYNVMGTMRVLGASAESNVSHVVLKSSTMVYGAHADNDAFLTEDSPLRGSRRYGYNHYRLEIESFINGFRRQAPQLGLALLRFANIVGPSASSPMNDYLREPVAPVLLGFDPMMQLIHEDDVVEALALVTLSRINGTFNVASSPALPLLRILGLMGRPSLPIFHPLAYLAVNWLGGNLKQRVAPFEPDYLRYRWIADLSKMQEILGFAPRYMGDEAVQALATHLRMKRYQKPRVEELAYDEGRLRATIERRRSRHEDVTPQAAEGRENG